VSYAAVKLDSQTPEAKAFQQARDQAKREQLWSRLRRRPADLLCFPEVRDQLQAYTAEGTTYSEVPLEAVVGSVQRCSDYTRSFLPLKDSDQQRWTRIKQAFADSKPLPPIQVVQLGQAYFVADGHHRVSVARQLGLSHLEAQILQAQSPMPVDRWDCCT
jgi:hypothetical protein